MPVFFWKTAFFATVLGYCLAYAPYGVNETDGGFLSGLAWQMMSGKTLYHDIVYVRPPLPVWLRVAELHCLPEHWSVLAERWIFYAKLALYSWLGALILGQGKQRWQLAVLGFIVSAHCYPPMAWHTVDGIFFAVLAAAPLGATRHLGLMLRGVFLCMALLCKQSFYPLLPLFALYFFWQNENRARQAIWFFSGFAAAASLFLAYLIEKNLLAGFLHMTGGSASGGQALQHGLLDYFRITPALALPSLVLLAPVGWWFWKGENPRFALAAWLFWLLALVASYAAVLWFRQEHTAPFAQSRAMFWVAVLWVFGAVLRSRAAIPRPTLDLALLLGISWCAAVSWGYNLPMLFATPWVWAGMEMTRKLWQNVPSDWDWLQRRGAAIFALVLLLAFRLGHEFVYRDGRRSEMHEPMGAIFPQLSGIYSDRETADLYRDFQQLAERYGPVFKTLPAFPQANFLTKTPPPLPLDWVVNREMSGDNALVIKNFEVKRPVVFVQKSFQDKIRTDPELSFTRQIFQQGKIIEETPHFWVIQ